MDLPKNQQNSKPAWATLTDLAGAAIGGEVLFATDEWFAPACMFLAPTAPVFKEGLFTDYGKWMDGWESRRKRIPGHDWCVLRLGCPGIVYGFEFDTAFFTGNNVPAASVQGLYAPDGIEIAKEIVDPATGAVVNTGMMGTACSPTQVQLMEDSMKKYEVFDLLPQSPLRPGYEDTRIHYYACKEPKQVTHLRINYFPDGGVARFRAFGEVEIPKRLKNIDIRSDFASALNGAVPLCWTDEHYGTPSNCLLPGRAPDMGNGWETARNPKRPGILQVGSDGKVDFSYAKDHFIMKMAARCEIEEMEIDTNHFKGNFPESVIVEVLDRPDLMSLPVLEQIKKFKDTSFQNSITWKILLPRTRMKPHAQQLFNRADPSAKIENAGPCTHCRITIMPDGGISRVRMHGKIAPAAGTSSL
eukprot:gnl/MRDRNA2_/MRDRNA2_34970_c0_seq1.p1 gnl/MRDRNA2_/MRDRNA2_34970_c0~~gnl/MRDRNA2_/MRDRNA2_34970_c0_seq1.p1  ORF type:complete len:415 (+),score=89.35 gnl/MRDRNA2_/MRDRNA2_34970_c0_seq1:86-1330(+)